MTIQMIFAVKVLETIHVVMEKIESPLLRFNLEKVRIVLENSIELARPLISEDTDQNQWLVHATTLEFQPIKKDVLLDGLPSIQVEKLRWLLMITRD